MTDLISRQAAKETVCSLCRWEGTENCDECEHPIYDIPSIDPVKHGEWAYREIRDYPIAFDRVGCTNCGWRFYSHPDEKDDQHRADRIATSYRFCPMCGAKMLEE